MSRLLRNLVVTLACLGAGSAFAESGEPPLPPIEGVSIAADVVYSRPVGSPPLHLDVYRPADRSGRLPLIVQVHGGGWTTGNKRDMPHLDFPEELAALARRGFVVASVEYRLSGTAAFPAALQDVQASVRYLRQTAATFGIDPGRVGLWGASAGAQLAALAAVTCDDPRLQSLSPETAETSACVQALVGWFGPYDVGPWLDSLSGNARGSVERGLSGARSFFHCTAQDCPADILEAATPMTHVGPGDPPTLLLHGAEDTLVPVSQSEAFLKALKAAGVSAELRILQGAGHGWTGWIGWSSRRNAAKAMAQTTEFFEAALSP